MSAVVTIPQCLWTKVCPNCGYSLEGAPSMGVCPECGRAYDQSEVILHGYARGGHENIANAKRSRLGWIVILSMGWVIYQVTMLSLQGGFMRWGTAFIALYLLPPAYLILRRQGSAHPGLVQIRLNSRGCVQYDDLGGASIVREFWRAYLWVIPVALAFGMLVAWWREWMDPIPFWCFFPIAVVASPFCLRSSYRFSRAMRKIREGSIADLNAALAEPTPWKRVSSSKLEKLSGGGYRFRVNVEHVFLSSTSPTPVDAEISATPEQIAELQELIVQWRDQSPGRA